MNRMTTVNFLNVNFGKILNERLLCKLARLLKLSSFSGVVFYSYLLYSEENGVKRLFILKKINYVSVTWSHYELLCTRNEIHCKLPGLRRVTFESKITSMKFEKSTFS